MPQQIESFGGDFRSRFWIVGQAGAPIILTREVVFDRDINGSWLIWAAAPQDESPEADQEDVSALGAIVVRDPVVSAFIETLAELVAHPDQFTHEPTFTPPPEGDP